MSNIRFPIDGDIVRNVVLNKTTTNILPLTLEEFYDIRWEVTDICSDNISVKVVKLYYSYIIEDNNTGRSIKVRFIGYMNDEDHCDVECLLNEELYEGEDTIGELLNRGTRTKSANFTSYVDSTN